MAKNKNNYKDSGVDIEKGQDFVEDIKTLTNKSNFGYLLSSIGGFSGYINPPSEFKDPVFALACDGVGTKLRIATRLNKYDTIGIDLVAMCVNDLIVSGAKPLAFLDYYGVEKLDRVIGNKIIEGILEGCRLSKIDLAGGETAEMPGHYLDGNFDLVGFAIGINEKAEILNNTKVKNEDVILGIASSGFHSNGYTLIHQIINKHGLNEDREFLEQLLTPTKIYTDLVADITNRFEVHSMAHITGGGLEENLSRAVPQALTAKVDLSSLKIPPLYLQIKELGSMEQGELLKVFNCGIGYCLIVNQYNAQKIISEFPEIKNIGFISYRTDSAFEFV